MNNSWNVVSAIANCVIALAAVAYTIGTLLVWRTARRSEEFIEVISTPIVAGPDPATNAVWERIPARLGWPGPERLARFVRF